MDWNNALMDSGIWLVQAYAITVALAAAIIWGLTRFTVWGRQFWALAAEYFSPRRNWRPLAALALILFLTLCGVRLEVLFSSWYNTMYSALQKLDEAGFWTAMLLFAILAATHIVRSLIDFYVQQAFTIRWRVWLNEKLLGQWLDRQSYYRSQYLDTPVDNPDQRIQQDVATFVEMSLSLSMGVVNALVSTFAFTLILWNLSGPLAVFGLDVPRAMVFLVFAYVLIATVFAIRIGRPLILLNFLNERFNADYRYALVRLREYSESIAFYAGERVEGALLRGRFANVIGNAWAIVYRTLKFLGFNFTVTQTAVVFPFIIQAQRFFSKQISLGDLMQTAQAFGRLQDNLSFFRNAYDSFATYRATLNRLSGFTKAIADAGALPEPDLREQGRELAVRGLTVTTPDGATLLNSLDLTAGPGESLLIRGPSGSGKTTLLRAVAGLWPYCRGAIVRPEGESLFLSQKPYLPQGSLRDALYYPRPAQTSTRDERVEDILAMIQLGHLVARLDQVDDWGRILSLGEQQRLAFGRLLLAAPRAAFLDEATSAMDEGLEDAMYRLVRRQLPDTVLLSVGHRSTLYAHHGRQLILKGDGTGAWELADTPKPAS
ncbi:ABC transporter ATP-binding protein/permease [Pollutimonas sp. M17]|uniref:ABC transporter ATP-binding protein/permease n=1 Tax=Pollutimonas sp. M17 TaxID=2962065 RepID=UPI0021F4BCC4|nr:ABC transporter ATP-binding protein/permease [Pollutimonas sp. M17]UYO94910.1 ABC transporter ATP-binding protein/permease [Pollutimonas sp. M17]